MSALPPSHFREMRHTAKIAAPSPAALVAKWAQLQVSADRLAKLAVLAPENSKDRDAEFSESVERAAEWQRELILSAIEDIEAMLHSGLSALAIVEKRGQDATAPAVALWRELHRAREGVLSIARPIAASA